MTATLQAPARGSLWRHPVVVAGLAALAGCGHGSGHDKKTETLAAPAPVSVTVAAIERRAVERTVPIEGTLNAWEDVTISAKKGGLVLRVLHDMGDEVKPGEVLVELDLVDAQLALAQAEASYLGELVKLGLTKEQAESFVSKYGLTESLVRNADVQAVIRELPAYKQAHATREKSRQELARQQELYGRGVGTLQDLQNMQNDYAAVDAALSNVTQTAQTTVAQAMASRAALNVARQELADMVVPVPVPGTLPEGFTNPQAIRYAVTRRVVREGQRIKDGDPLIELIVEDPIRLWVPVPERYRPQIETGQSARISAMSRPGETFEGKVARISPAVDDTNRTFQVEALIPNPEGKLRPGGFALGQIIVEKHSDAIVVPIESIYRFAGVIKIFVVADGKARGYPVRVGRQDDGRVEVQSDSSDELPTSGQVVTTGQTALAEGTTVVIREPATDSVAPALAEAPSEPTAPQAADAGSSQARVH